MPLCCLAKSNLNGILCVRDDKRIRAGLLRKLLFMLLMTTCFNAQSARVAIILDDIGYRQTDLQSLSLPVAVTLSILPHTPLGQAIGQQAHQQQREVMLHMPMEALSSADLGPGTLTSQMSSGQIQQHLEAAFDSIPMAVGLNNHMGSKLTSMPAPMDATMQWLRHKNMFFVDSRTTTQTRAQQAAIDAGLPVLRRHVFLDNSLSDTALQQQIKTLIRIAKRKQSAIGIAHPHPETLNFLRNIDSYLAEHGVELVPVSQLLPTGLAFEPAKTAINNTGK